MKTLLLLLFIIFSLAANATNYYLSTSGNDANPGTDPSAPWKTLDKLNSFKTLKPGDNVLFKRGDTFYGSITVSNSGAAGNPITYGAYGTGENPVITGFNNVTKWTNLGGNIWESTNAVSALSKCNMVVINGVNTAMGRYPNSGYLTYQSYSGTNSITSSSLTGTPDWTGAEVVIKKDRYVIDRNTITSQSGGTLYYSGTSGMVGTNNNGFFIQNDSITLDSANEWYYNPSTKKIRIFSISSPTNVKVATVDTLVFLSYIDYLTFNNISFEGNNNAALFVSQSNNIVINTCTINYSGSGIYGETASNFTATNNIINNSNRRGIYLDPNCHYSTISYNSITNTGMIPGLGEENGQGRTALLVRDNSITEYNSIVNAGYNGIAFSGGNCTINRNYIDSVCIVTDDGAGIYTYGSGAAYINKVISNNIILNSIGNSDGTNNIKYFPANGIYLDDNTENVTVFGNTVANCANYGIFLHNALNCKVLSNNVYNCYKQIRTSNDIFAVNIVGDEIKNNIFFSKIGTQMSFDVASIKNDILNFFNSDSNYIMKPISDSLTIFTKSPGDGGTFRSLAGWQTYTGLDIHSHTSPKTISDTNDLRFEYNAASTSKTIRLDANYIDATGQVYNGTITLAPYSSAVLIRNGAIINLTPIANAGTNQTITLPANTASLTGSGTDSDGSISSYNWTKLSGPSGGSITNANSASTTVTGLVQGIYQFELKVTDNNGATGKDTMQLTVNTALNQPPTANAGVDLVITLPTNTVTLNGSGKDTDGIAAIFFWTKISGPSSFNITNTASPITDVSGLLQGVYEFELQVTDNNGAVGRDTVRVTVNAAANISPIANAGSNQTITLPLNSVTLSGSGSDADGTVVSYLWTKISGPSTYNISSSSSAATTVSGLVQGVYQFELKATDNKGAVGKDTVQITVNAAANIPPSANAGADQAITLPTSSVSLSGSGTDSDGTITSFQWTKISGPSAYTIANSSSAVTTISGLVQGVYQFELKATDNIGAIGKDTVQITVNAAPNMPPTADAGSNQSITLPTSSVSLSGSGTGSDGTISSYVWTKISGPASYNIVSSSSAVTSVTGLVDGVYQFELKVTDNNGAQGKDTVKVTVKPAMNIPPVAQAGSNQTITLPINTIALNGSGKDSDGTISSYLWTKIAGPAAGTITDTSSALTTVKGLIEGNYIFKLTVTDNQGAKGTDSIYVTVYAPKNIAPTANAGGDLTIVLPLNTVYLNGSGSDTDGTITAYHWKQVAGPDSASITTDNKPSTEVKNLVAGTYEFELTVTDNNAETGSDTVRVVVALGRISAEPNSITIYPNPVKDIATVEIHSENINSQLTLFISDFAGKIVYKKQIKSSDYETTEKINMSTFSKGSYTISVFFNVTDKQIFPIIKL